MIIGRNRDRMVRRIVVACTILTVGLILAILLAQNNAASAHTLASSEETSVTSGQMRYDTLPSDQETVADYVTTSGWKKNPVTYNIKNCPRSLDCGLAQQAVREAAEAWDAVCGLRLDEVAPDVLGDIEISWQPRNHGDGQPFDGPGGILGHSFYPNSGLGALSGDVHLDDSETWVADPPTNPIQVHLKTVAMHEIGHALGLKHSKDPTALMYAEYSGVRGLGPDDIAGIQSLYGPPSPDEPGITPMPTPDGITAVAATTVRMRSGPGTNYPIVGRIPVNTAVVVMGHNADSSWLFVSYFSTQGWAASHLFSIMGDLSTVPVVDANGNGVPPQSPTVFPTTPSADSPTGMVATAKITTRVRSGPGTGYPMIARVMTGETVPLLGKNTDSSWLYIDVEGVRGWAAARLFSISGDLSVLPIITP
jgi:uncharacterized protein YraI/predicted Zn-dependent protease